MRSGAPCSVLRSFRDARGRTSYDGSPGVARDRNDRFADDLPVCARVSHGGLSLDLSGHRGDASSGATVFAPTEGLDAPHPRPTGHAHPRARHETETDDRGREMTVPDPSRQPTSRHRTVRRFIGDPRVRLSLPAFVFALLAGPATAQDAPTLAVELNAAQTLDGTCRLTFVVTNGAAAPQDVTVFETVLFTTEGTVDRLTLFDFGTLPPGRARVRQFDVDGLTCDGLGQILFNGAARCEGAMDVRACEAALIPTSRTGIAVAG